jgi:uncharacterized protein YaaQ
MAEIPPFLKEAQQTGNEFIAGITPVNPRPTPSYDPQANQSFGQNFYDSATMTPPANLLKYLYDRTVETQVKGYRGGGFYGKPLEAPTPSTKFDLQEYLANDIEKVGHAYLFADIHNREIADRTWATFKNNEAARERIAKNNDFWAGAAAELTNPINYIPGASITRGVGFVRGFVRGMGAALPSMAASEAIRLTYDPTSNLDEAKTNLLWGTAILGGFGAIAGVLRKPVTTIAKNLADETRILVGDPVTDASITVRNDPLADAARPLTSVAQGINGSVNPYVATATGTTRTGYSSGGWIGNILKKQGPFARVVNSGVRAYEDLANRFAGDNGVQFARNEDGIATETSAYLASKRWQNMAVDLTMRLRNLHANYIMGSSGKTADAFGINLVSAGARTKDFIRSKLGQSRPDGKLMANQFDNEVLETYWRAQETGVITHQIPEIAQGAAEISRFMESMLDQGIKSGYFRTPQNMSAFYLRRLDKLNPAVTEWRSLVRNKNKTDQQIALQANLKIYISKLVSEMKYSRPKTAPIITGRSSLKLASTPIAGSNDNIEKVLIDPPMRDIKVQYGPTNKVRGPKTGYTRLYRFGNDPNAKPANVSEWIQQTEDYQNSIKATGRWFSDTIEEAEWYKSINENGELYYVDVLTSDVEKYRVSNIKGLTEDGLDPASFSRRRENELFLPRDIASSSEPYANVNKVNAFYNETDKTIFFDYEATIASFNSKPWTKPKVEGVDPLPENAFETPEEWAEFVLRHELNHTSIRRGTLSTAEYENLINRTSLEQMDDISNTHQVLGMKQADARLVAANENVDDVSNFKKFYFPHRYRPDLIVGREEELEKIFFDHFKENPNSFEAELLSRTSVIDELQNNIDNIAAQIDEVQKNTYFISIAKAQTLLEDINKTAQVGLAKKQAIYDGLLDKGNKTGLTPKQQIKLDQLKSEIDNNGYSQKQLNAKAKLEKQIDDYNNKRVSYKKLLTDKQVEYIGNLIAKQKKLQLQLKNANEAKTKLDVSRDDESVMLRAKAAVQNILHHGEPFIGEGPLPVGSGRAFFAKRRAIDIPTAKVKDFIENDLNSTIKYYTHRMGLGSEYTAAFGTPDGELAISEASIQAIRESEGKSLAEINDMIFKNEDDIRTLRDFNMGRYHQADQFGKEEAKILRSWFVLSTMGKAALASMTEVIRPMMVLGFKENFETVLKALGDTNRASMALKEIRDETTYYAEMAQGELYRRVVDSGFESFGTLTGKYNSVLQKIERPLSWAQTPFYLLNGLTMLTYFQKAHTGLVASSVFCKRILRVGNGTATKEDMTFLASYGIGKEEALLMAKEPIEKDGGAIFANTKNWSNKELGRQYYRAVDSLINRTIVTSSAADKPAIAMGIVGRGLDKKEVSALALPFQLKTWALAANNKVLLSALQGRDANVKSGMLMMVGVAYYVNSLKVPDYVWDKMSEEEKIANAVDSSGILALLTDVNFAIEQTSSYAGYPIGMRPALGIDPKFGDPDVADAAGVLTGPATQKALDTWLAINGGTSKDKARAIINALPGQNMIWVKDSWRKLARDELEGMLE